MIKIGFWDEHNMPKRETAELWYIITEVFLCKLESIQEKLTPIEKFTEDCLYCGQELNGYVYQLDNYTWKSTYSHYIDNHFIDIDDKFFSFIMRKNIKNI